MNNNTTTSAQLLETLMFAAAQYSAAKIAGDDRAIAAWTFALTCIDDSSDDSLVNVIDLTCK